MEIFNLSGTGIFCLEKKILDVKVHVSELRALLQPKQKMRTLVRTWVGVYVLSGMPDSRLLQDINCASISYFVCFAVFLRQGLSV